MTDQLAAQLQGLHFSGPHPSAAHWQPAVNVYAHGDRLEVCVDLAGVRKQDIKVDVEPRRLVVHGHREPPDCGSERKACGRVLAMEIADGPFQRVLELPVVVDTSKVEARQDNGWLWITLPRVRKEED